MSQTQAAFFFMLPFCFVYFAFLVYPFAIGFWISLHDWNLLEVAFNPDAKEFVGFKNYIRIFWGRNIEWSPITRPILQLSAFLLALILIFAARRRRLSVPVSLLITCVCFALFICFGFEPGDKGRWYDRRFWPAVGNTLEFVAITVPLVTTFSLVLAAALSRETRAMAVLRTIFFVSSVLSVTVVTLIWLLIYSPGQGIIANLADFFGGERMAWLTHEHLAMPALIITTVWWSIGIAMILFLAGLQDISKDIYEAAALDNAKGIRAFWYITLPNMGRTITLVVVLQIIAHFQMFGQAHLMTTGGPNDRTQSLVRYIYLTAFRDSDLGEASAMAVFLFAVIGVFSLMQFLIGRESDQ